MRVMVTVEEIVRFFEKYQENMDSSKNIKKIWILRRLCEKFNNIFLVGLCLERQKLSSKNSFNNALWEYNFTKLLFEGFFICFSKIFINENKKMASDF